MKLLVKSTGRVDSAAAGLKLCFAEMESPFILWSDRRSDDPFFLSPSEQPAIVASCLVRKAAIQHAARFLSPAGS